MTIEEALNKANEGGYHINGSDGMDTYYEGANSEYSVWTRKDNESSFIVPMEATLLDPTFWHALGRALGWSEGCELAITCVHGDEECRRCRGYYLDVSMALLYSGDCERETPCRLLCAPRLTPGTCPQNPSKTPAGEARRVQSHTASTPSETPGAA